MARLFKMIRRLFKWTLGLTVLGAIWLSWQLLSPASLQKQEQVFTVADGQAAKQISRDLKAAGLIKSQLVFEGYLRVKGQAGEIKAGRYDLNTGMSLVELTNVLLAGQTKPNYNLTFIEGWDRDEYAAYLAKQGLSGQQFLALTASPDAWLQDFSFLKGIPSGGSLEGFLFPDTYNINEFTTEETLTRRMLKDFQDRLSDDLVAEVTKSGRNLFEVITLASIVENEVSDPEARATVAGIFYNRLDSSIGLQSDATINFITGKGHRRPELADLEIDSPYNTYKYRGLPPGPISNPGLDSIKAVIYPKETDFLYFLTNKDGQIFYAKTFEEHQSNRDLYLD